MARSRRGAAELSLLLSTTALSLIIAVLALVGIRFLSGASTVTTPESAMEHEAEMYIELLKNTGTPQCVHPYLANTPEGRAAREYMKASVSAILREKWISWLGEPKLLELTAEGVVCPSQAELAAQGASYEAQDCGEAKQLAFVRTEAALMKYRESGAEEDLTTWKNLYATSLANNPKTPYGCGVTDADFSELISEERGRRCFSHDDCTVDWYCVTPHDESLSRADRLAASLLGRESGEGTCEMIPGSQQCWRDADCSEGFTCEAAPQIGAPCMDGFCPLPALGKCTEVVHPVAEEHSGEEGLTEDHPITLQEVKEELTEELGHEPTPKEALEEYNEQLADLLEEHEEATGEELTPEEYEQHGLQDSEAQGDAIVAETTAELAPLFSDATLKLVSLSSAEGLSEEAEQAVQEGLEVVGGQLQALAQGETVDVVMVINALEAVHDVLPPDVVAELDDATRDERVEGALGGVRVELRSMEDMLTWIGKFIDALRDAGYTDGNLDLWSRLVETATKAFYEEMLPKCDRLFDQLRDGIPGDMEQCFANVESLFRPLEESMRGEIEAAMNAGDEKVMQAMMAVGMPPMMGDDHGGNMQGGPGGPGMDPEYCFDACEQRLGITDLISRSDHECVEPQAPECIEAEQDSPECEALFNACDLQILGPDISQALSYCQDACARGMGGEREGGYDMREQQGMKEQHMNEMYMNAALSCCSMDRGGDFSCIDNFLPPMALQFHPNIPLPGVDAECPNQQGYSDVCSGPWDGMHEDCDRYGHMDPMCMLEHLRYFPEECKPPADDPIWNVGDMRQGMGMWESPEMYHDNMSCEQKCSTPGAAPEQQASCIEMCHQSQAGQGGYPGGMPYPGGGMQPSMPYQGGGMSGGSTEACEARRADECNRVCAQFPNNQNCASQCLSGPSPCGMGGGMPGGQYPGGMPYQGDSMHGVSGADCDARVAECQRGCANAPGAVCSCNREAICGGAQSGPMHPGGTMPSGMYPSGMYPSGMMPSGMYPSGMYPSGMYPSGMYPSGTMPSGMYPSGMYPSGTMPSGTYPMPSGSYPSGSYPMPSGTTYPMHDGSYSSGGTYTPPPSGSTYTPPPDGGSYTPPPDSGSYSPPPSEPHPM